jgi:hypothetical protein
VRGDAMEDLAEEFPAANACANPMDIATASTIAV